MHMVRNVHSSTPRKTAVLVRAKEKVKAKEKGAVLGLGVEVETDHRHHSGSKRYAHTICKVNARKAINVLSNTTGLACSLVKAFAEKGNIACSHIPEK